jgi:fluoride exporter
MFGRFSLVFFAGGLGAATRYAVGLWAGQRLGVAFPFGTLIVNVVGCFLIAVVMQTALQVANFPPNLRLALTTGFMGGLTTYSSFNYETTKLLQEGALTTALVNFFVTAAGCFAAGLLGAALVRQLSAS